MIRNMILGALALLAFGCGVPPPSVDYLPSCSHALQLDAPEVGYNEVAQDFAIAREIITRGTVEPDRFCDLFATITIRVRPELAWDVPGHTDVVGMYYDDRQLIELGWSMKGLLHEMLHRWEHSIGVANSGDHPEWGPRGLYALDLEYQDARIQVVRY